MQFIRFFIFHLFRDPDYLFWYVVRRLQKEYRVGVRFYTMDELFKKLQEDRKSLIRMGDGEAYIIHRGSIGYEPYTPELRSELLQIIEEYYRDGPYILCLPEMDINKTNSELAQKDRLQCWLPLKILYSQIFPKNKTYGDAVTFYYAAFRKFFFGLIENRDIIIVTNQDIADSLNHKYLDGASSLQVILTPEVHAYGQKAEIICQIHHAINLKKKNNILLLFACGPLSKVLSYKYSQDGIQSIDIGRGIELISFRSEGNLEFLL